jgi:putative peptidoglycan lipid II flippase
VTPAREADDLNGAAEASGTSTASGPGIGRYALVIGAITAVANVVGFGRQLVFAHTVGSGCLGTVYATANQVPNIIYAIVLGGALTGMVVPVLAGPVAGRVSEDIRQTSSALLSWTVLLLVPASAVVALAARPVVSALLGSVAHCTPRAGLVNTGSQMLAVFAPQIALYGLAVVGYGILQAHRRFTAPALAPVLSSVVVAAAYFAFVPLADGHQVNGLPEPAELMLAIGTTAGVAALALTALAPVGRLRLGLRPTLHFPPGVAARVRSLALAGVAAVIAQNVSTAVVIVLANSRGGNGALVLYNYGWQVFFVPYAVLAVPIATSAFPVLSASAKAGRGDFDAAAASSTRGAMLVSWLGAALLAGACVPASRVFLSHADDLSQARELAWGLLAFAPGLAGFGLAANLSRLLFAGQRARAAAVTVTGGWLLVIVADLVIVPLVPGRWVVPALGLGNSIGLTAAGIALVVAVRRARGRAALSGVLRACAAGLAAAVAGGLAGAGVSAALATLGLLQNAGVVILACVAALLAFGLVAFALDGGELRALAGRLRARFGRGGPGQAEPAGGS